MYWWREEEGERDGLLDGLLSSVLCQNQLLKGGKSPLNETQNIPQLHLGWHSSLMFELS